MLTNQHESNPVLYPFGTIGTMLSLLRVLIVFCGLVPVFGFSEPLPLELLSLPSGNVSIRAAADFLGDYVLSPAISCDSARCCCVSGPFTITQAATASQIQMSAPVVGPLCQGQTSLTLTFDVVSASTATFVFSSSISFTLTLSTDQSTVILTNSFSGPQCATGGVKNSTAPASDSTVVPTTSMCASILAYPGSTSLPVSFTPRNLNVTHVKYAGQVEAHFAANGFSPLLASLKSLVPACAARVASIQCAAAYGTNSTITNLTRSLCVSMCEPLQVICPTYTQNFLSYNYLDYPITIPEQLRITSSSFLNCSSDAVFPDGVPLWSNSSDCIAPEFSTLGQTQSATISQRAPTAQCATYTGTTCAGVIDYPIYIPANKSIEEYIAETDAAALTTFRLGVALAPRENGCQASLARLQCQQAFPACAQSASMLGAVFRSPACQDDCQHFTAVCGSFISSSETIQALLSVNCSTTGSFIPAILDPITGSRLNRPVENFPNSTYLCDGLASSSTPNCSCNALQARVDANNVTTSPTVSCPPGMRVRTAFDTSEVALTDSCTTTCPSALFSQADWDSSDVVMNVCSVFSFVLNLFAMLTYLIFPEKRKMSRILLTLLCTLFALSFAFFLVTCVMKGRHQDVGCVRNGAGIDTQTTQPVSLCNFESFMIIWAATAVAYLWASMCVDVASKTVFNVRHTPERQRLVDFTLIGISFGVPSFFFILSLSYTQLGRSVNVPWCLMGGGGPSTPKFVLFASIQRNHCSR